MASLAGQFAGIVHFEVSADGAEPLATALRSLESSGLRVVIAASSSTIVVAEPRMVRLELVGNDRPGIVSDLSASLAELGVSIHELETEIVSAPMSADRLFQVTALLAVPKSVADDALRGGLEALANEMMVDIAIDDPTHATTS